MASTPEQRFDVATLSRGAKLTPQGFLRIPAGFTRTGILSYERAGQPFKEYRPPEEVFHADSIASLVGVPLTDMHPIDAGKLVMVTPANVTKYTVGVVNETMQRVDGRVLGGYVTVMDATAIAAVQSGKRRALSCGYNTALELTPGEVGGERYDAVQTHIRYNHLALLPPFTARAGDDAALRLDQAGLVQRFDSTPLSLYVRQQMDLQGIDEVTLAARLGIDIWAIGAVTDGFASSPPKDLLQKVATELGLDLQTLIDLVPMSARALDLRTDSKRGGTTMEEETVTINGMEFKLPKLAAQAFRADRANSAAQVAEHKATTDKLQGRFDAMSAELTEVKAKLATAEDPKRFDQAVADRLGLVSRAQRVLGDEKLDGLGRREVMVKAIAKQDPTVNLEGKSDDYVESRFDQMVDGMGSTGAGSHFDSRKVVVDGQQRADASDSEKARQKFETESASQWKQPLAYHS